MTKLSKQKLHPTYVYVDGFNLFYGAVRKTPYKWLDLGKLCSALLPQNDILRIKYFTAHVSARPNDPDKPGRQQAFLRALQTIPHLEIILGHFLSNPCMMPTAESIARGKPKYIEVIKTEEKGSDVNMAAHFIHDAHQGAFEVGVLMTNDSDLAEAVRIVKQDLRLTVGILNPTPTTNGRESCPATRISTSPSVGASSAHASSQTNSGMALACSISRQVGKVLAPHAVPDPVPGLARA